VAVELLDIDLLLRARLEGAAAFGEAESAIGGVTKAAVAAGVVLAAGLAVGFVKSVQNAGAFQRQMELVSTQAGYSQASVQKLSASVLELAGRVGVAPEELAKGLYHIASAGFPASQAMEMLTAAAKLSVVGMTDMDSASQAIVGVLAAWPKTIGGAAGAAAELNAIVGCVPLDTEVLTRRGWLRHDQVRAGDQALGFDPQSGLCAWSPVLNVVHHRARQVVELATGAGWSAQVTSHHRWWSDEASGFVETAQLRSGQRIRIAAPGLPGLSGEQHVAPVQLRDLGPQPVWCPTTGLGSWTMRQGGRISLTGNSGDMRMSQLTSAMSTGVLPAAETFGLSLRDVGAALATITDNVTPADEAATRLRMTFALLGAPSQVASKALRSIGLSAEQATGATAQRDASLKTFGITVNQLGADLRKPNGLLVAIQDLRDHMTSAGMNAQEQAAIIARAFGGGRTATGIMTLLEQFDRFKGKYASLALQSNDWANAWQRTQDTFNAQWADFTAGMDAASIQFGERFLPAATGVLRFLTSQFVPALQNTVIPALSALFMSVGGSIGSGISKLGTSVGSLQEAFTGRRTSSTTSTGKGGQVERTQDTSGTPSGAQSVFGAATALGASSGLAASISESFGPLVDRLAQVGKAFDVLFGNIQSGGFDVHALTGFFNNLGFSTSDATTLATDLFHAFDQGKRASSELWPEVKKLVAQLADLAQWMGDHVIPVLVWLIDHGDLVKAALIAVGVGFAAIKTGEAIAGILQFTSALRDATTAAGGASALSSLFGVGRGAQSFLFGEQAAADTLPGLGGGKPGAIKQVVTWVSDSAAALADFAAVTTKAGVEAVKTRAVWLGEQAKIAAGWVTTAAGATASFVATTVSSGVEAVKTKAVWLGEQAKIAAGWVTTAAGATASFVATTLSSGVEAAKNLGIWIGVQAKIAAGWVATQSAAAASYIATAAAANPNSNAAAIVWLASQAKIAAGWIATQATALVSFAATAVSAGISAALTELSWRAAQLMVGAGYLALQVKALASFAATAVSALISAAQTELSWRTAQLMAGAGWLGLQAKAIASGVATKLSAGVEAGETGLAWLGAQAKIGLGWVAAQVETIASFVAVAAASVVQTAIVIARFLLAQGAILAVRGATLLWAAAQAILDVALSANVISLVIIAVAALVAGIIWAYQNVGWFRAAVNLAFQLLKDFGSWIEGTLVPVLERIGGRIADLGRTIGEGLKNGFLAGINFLIDRLDDFIGAIDSLPGLSGVIPKIARLSDGGVIPAMPQLAGGGVLGGYAPGRDSVLALLSPGEGVLRPEAVRWLGEGAINSLNRQAKSGTLPAFADGGILSGAPGVLTAPIRAALDAAINTLPGAWLRDLGHGIEQDLFGHLGVSIIMPGVSGDVATWLSAALSATGAPGSWLSDLGLLVSKESGGNPSAVNSTPVGSEHATGLMQMLPSTYEAHRLPSLPDNILDPVSNAASAIEYILGRYGAPGNIPGLHGGDYQGYDTGGILAPGRSLAWNGTGRPEQVLSPGQGGKLEAVLDRLLVLLEKGSLGGEVHLHAEGPPATSQSDLAKTLAWELKGLVAG
jgi:TP901 family phage tail tape measure protein